MKHLLFIFILTAFFVVSIQAQSSGKVSILVSNCEATEGICSTQHLYRYDFQNGEFVSKELIITTKTNDVRFDLGGNRIYQNRYVITNWGDIIDVKEKKILHESEGQLFRVEGSKIFIKVDREDKDGLYVYDLETRKYDLYKKTDIKMFFGELSPNGIRSVEWTCPVDEGCKIKIWEFGSKLVREFKGQFNVQRTGQSCDIVEVPVFWIDDERFLTQKNNGEILIGDIKGSLKPLLKIKIKELPTGNPKFYRDQEGRIIYDCFNEYLINVDKRTYSEAGTEINDDFSAKGDEYFFKGKSIGEVYSAETKTNRDFIAVIYGKKGSNLGYPDGVKVWNSIKKDWTTIEIKWSPQLIGWIEQ